MFIVPERWPCTLDFGVGLVYAWQDSLICATWLPWRDSCVTWLMCGSTELIHMGYDSFIWDMTYWYVRHDSCDVTPTWHDSNVAGQGLFTWEITPQTRVVPEAAPCTVDLGHVPCQRPTQEACTRRGVFFTIVDEPSHLSSSWQIPLKMLHPQKVH